jgi:hypothetical protein
MMASHTKPSRDICFGIIAAFLLASISTALYARDSLTIDKVEWNAAPQALIVEGQSDTLNLVFLSDEITLEEFAQVQADDDGKWLIKIKLADLPAIPCAISATSGGRRVYKRVENSPVNCSSATLTQELTANIYSEKFCDVCHGPTGLGDPGPNIEGADLADINRAMVEEEVHQGIVLSNRQAEALDAFLHNPGPLVARETPDFSDPEMCATCHPRQFKEWSGSSMAYSALSPTFSALESLGTAYVRTLDHLDPVPEGFAAGDHGTALFCQRCHNPVDFALGNFPTFEESDHQPLRNFASEAGRAGLSCDVCHQVMGPNTSQDFLGWQGDGISNTAFILNPGLDKYSPLKDVKPSPTHLAASAHDITGQPGYLRTGEFCGTCHDVRTPPDPNFPAGDPLAEDPNEGFQRLENLFTEWKTGPYGPDNNSVGGVVTCQDCHMDLGPPAPAGSFADGDTTVFPRPSQVDEREEVRTHYFTGIDIALVDFPGQDDEARDENGNVIGQVQRREILMGSAAELAVTAPSSISAGDTLPIEVHVTNSGTGHNLPSGFSQERQVWVELNVSDGNGDMIYQSGYLIDMAHPETGEMAPDGNFDDEDLRNLVGPDGFSSGIIDPITLEADLDHGLDYNRRHEDPPVNLGLANFGNEFIRIPVDADGNPEMENGHVVEEEVFMPFLSTHTDNSHSIPALETADVPYDVGVPAGTVGPINVTARLRARAFPPRFLRALAVGRPDLVNETMVDRNRIVEMVSAAPVSIDVN